MNELFAKNSDTTLGGFIVWVPMLPSDTSEAIPMPGSADKRIKESWDSRKLISKAFSPVLGLNEDTWDVYLIFPSGEKWLESAPPKPVFWMHQLSKGAENQPRLDPKSFEEQVRRQLSQAAALLEPHN